MADDIQVEIPDFEKPDLEAIKDTLNDIPDLSNIQELIEEKRLAFKNENMENEKYSFHIPDDLILQYTDKATFQSCTLLTEELNKNILKIQINYLSTRKAIFSEIDKIIPHIDGYRNERLLSVERFESVVKNFEMKKLELIKETNLPKCLQDYVPKADKPIEMKQLIEAEMKSSLKLLYQPHQFELFQICEKIEEILDNGIFEDIQKLKQQRECVSNHCSPHLPYVVDVLDRIMLPYDRFNGNFRAYRLSIYKTDYPKFGTIDGKKFLARLDHEYRLFQETFKSSVREIELKFEKEQ